MFCYDYCIINFHVLCRIKCLNLLRYAREGNSEYLDREYLHQIINNFVEKGFR